MTQTNSQACIYHSLAVKHRRMSSEPPQIRFFSNYSVNNEKTSYSKTGSIQPFRKTSGQIFLGAAKVS